MLRHYIAIALVSLAISAVASIILTAIQMANDDSLLQHKSNQYYAKMFYGFVVLLFTLNFMFGVGIYLLCTRS